MMKRGCTSASYGCAGAEFCWKAEGLEGRYVYNIQRVIAVYIYIYTIYIYMYTRIYLHIYLIIYTKVYPGNHWVYEKSCLEPLSNQPFNGGNR